MSNRINLNESLVLEEDGDTRSVICVHCGHVIADSDDYRPGLAYYEGPNTDAGPQIWPTPSDYIDQAVVFRQWYCPNCFVAVVTEVVPRDHPDVRDEIGVLVDLGDAAASPA